MLLWSEHNLAACGHDCLDAHRLVMVTLRQAKFWCPKYQEWLSLFIA